VNDTNLQNRRPFLKFGHFVLQDILMRRGKDYHMYVVHIAEHITRNRRLQKYNNNNNNNNNNNTEREVTANRPDIIIKNQKEKTCTLIFVAIPADRNVVQKEAEKKLKYKGLCIEIQRMWNLKCTIIPVIIGATGIVTRSLRKNLEAVPEKHSILSLQKTALLGT
jgi:hypothetical protein